MEFLLILASPLAAAILPAFVRSKRSIIEGGTLLAAACVVGGIVRLALQVASEGAVTYSGYLALDPLGALFAIVVALVGCSAAFYAVGYLREETRHGSIGMHRVRQFFALFNLFLFSMLAAIVTTNPVLMWIAIEATTLSTVFLISFYGKPNTVEAAWKFLIINSVALLLGFLGTLLFMSTSATFGSTWLFTDTAAVDGELLKIAFILVIIGFGTKTGFVPLHTWLPDAHGMAPSPISSLLSGALLNVSFYALLRFKILIDPVLGVEFSRTLFVAFGVLSVSIAALLIFSQRNYKRLLAYSSIEHMGIMALGCAVGGSTIFASLLHMIYHAITKSLLFLASGTIVLKYATAKIAGIKGLARVLPLTAPLFFLGLLSITGVPPFGIFFTELSILVGLMSLHPVIAAVLLISLVLVFIGVMKHASSMMGGDAPRGTVERGEFNAWTVVPLGVLALLLLALSIGVPPVLETLLQAAVERFNR